MLDLELQQQFIDFAKEWIVSYLLSKKLKFVFGSLDDELIVKFIWNNNSYEFKSTVEVKKFFGSGKRTASATYNIVNENYLPQCISDNSVNMIFSVVVQKDSEFGENIILQLDGSMIIIESEKGFKIIYLCLDNWLSQYIENFSKFSEIDEEYILSESFENNISRDYDGRRHFINYEEDNEIDYDFTGKRILLVEDNELTKEIAETILELKNMLVDTAANGAEAVDKFRENDIGYYDAILMDIMMPVKTGLEATVEIRASEKDDSKSIPIIAMTGNAFSEDVAKSFESGMNEHILKPIDPKKLYNVLDRFIGRGFS